MKSIIYLLLFLLNSQFVQASWSSEQIISDNTQFLELKQQNNKPKQRTKQMLQTTAAATHSYHPSNPYSQQGNINEILLWQHRNILALMRSHRLNQRRIKQLWHLRQQRPQVFYIAVPMPIYIPTYIPSNAVKHF